MQPTKTKKPINALLFLASFWFLGGCGPDSSFKPGFKGGFEPCSESSKTRNLECEDALVDTNAPFSFAFPGTSKLAQATDVSISVNETGSTIYYTLDGSAPGTSSSEYNENLTISLASTLRYFAVDTESNFEQARFEKYSFDSSVPELELTSLASNFTNSNGTINLEFNAATGAAVSIEVGGIAQLNSGTSLWTGTGASGLSVDIEGAQLTAGENKIFVFTTLNGATAYSSFYLVLDDLEAFVQADPDEGSFADSQSVRLFTVEPATIYYTQTTNGDEPAEPDTSSSIYIDPLLFDVVPDDEIEYKIKYFSIDLAGNVSDTASKTYLIDNKAPVINPTDSGSLVDNGTGLDPFIVAGSEVIAYVSEAMETKMEWDSEEDCTYVVEVGGEAEGEGTEIESGSCQAFETIETVLLAGYFTEGRQDVKLYATDSVGNVADITWIIFLDIESRAPVLLQPLLGASEKSSNVNLSWQDMASSETDLNESGILRYELEYDTNINFASATAVNEFGTSRLLSGLADGRYYWRIRTVDEVLNESDWSGIRHFYVGSAASDIEGDDLEDIVVGAPGDNSEDGRAYVFVGDSGESPPIATTIHYILEGEVGSAGRFGEVVAVTEDINGGGKADVLVSAPSFGTDAGRVYLFYGENLGCGGPPCTMNASAADVIISGQGGDDFGISLSYGGDFNKDGFGDIIIGATSAQGAFVNTGVAYMFTGGPGLVSGSSDSADIIFQGQESGEAFGSCVTNAGDINGDGVTDILVGAASGDSLLGTATGIVYVFFGSTSADSESDTFFVGSQFSGSDFGRVCARGFDTNLDGYEDVYVGAPSDPSFGTNYGKAYVYRGGSTVLTVPEQQFNAGGTSGLFGSSITGLNYDTDGYADMLISAPGVSDAYHYDFDDSAGNFVAGVVFTGAVGSAVGLWGDLDAAGKDYFMIGDASFNSDEGRVAIYDESNTPVICLSRGGITACGSTSGVAGEEFGASVSVRP